jgi:hypothetical protein
VLSGTVLCDRPITLPEDPTDCGVSECDREASIMRGLCPTGGCSNVGEKMNVQKIIVVYSHNQTKLPQRSTEFSHFKPTGTSQYQIHLMSAGVKVSLD